MTSLRFTFFIAAILAVFWYRSIAAAVNKDVENESIADRIKWLTNAVKQSNKSIDKIVTREEKMFKEIMTRLYRIETGGKRWKFQGNGDTWMHADDVVSFHVDILDDCKKKCYDKYIDDRTWNGLVWNSGSGVCYCAKNDRGHLKDSDSYLHYKM